MSAALAWVAYDGLSPWGSGAKNAAIVTRLGGKCVENVAGGQGIVASVDHVGTALVVFASGVKEHYQADELKVVACETSGDARRQSMALTR
jgi:hypothetical protein